MILCQVEILTTISRRQQGINGGSQLYQSLDTVNSARPRQCQGPQTPEFFYIPPGRMPRRYGVHCAGAASPRGAKPIPLSQPSTNSVTAKSSTAAMIHSTPNTDFLGLWYRSKSMLFPSGQRALVDKPHIRTARWGSIERTSPIMSMQTQANIRSPNSDARRVPRADSL